MKSLTDLQNMRPLKVKQWWLLFHETDSNKNMIMSQPHTADVLNISKHIQQHVVSIEDFNLMLKREEIYKKMIEALKIQRDDAIWNRFKTNPKYEKVFFADELAKIMDAELDDTLTATEQKLKDLTEEK